MATAQIHPIAHGSVVIVSTIMPRCKNVLQPSAVPEVMREEHFCRHPITFAKGVLHLAQFTFMVLKCLLGGMVTPVKFFDTILATKHKLPQNVTVVTMVNTQFSNFVFCNL